MPPLLYSIMHIAHYLYVFGEKLLIYSANIRPISCESAQARIIFIIGYTVQAEDLKSIFLCLERIFYKCDYTKNLPWDV